MSKKLFRTPSDMEELALDKGFLPFFYCGIDSLSVEEHTPGELWFSPEHDGPWEWKGPVIQEGHCAYGKFFNKKAGYVALEWLPDFANYRRSRYAAYSEDMAAVDDIVLQTIETEGSANIKQLRAILGFAKGRGKRKNGDEDKISLEPILNRLQMQARVVIADFEYNIDRHGRRYGWGVARYTTPRGLYGIHYMDAAAGRSPEESLLRMVRHLKRKCPSASEADIRHLLE